MCPLPPRIPRTLLAAGLAAVLASLPAAAETNPYYVGIAQTFTHENNLLRLPEDQKNQGGIEAADTISSTSLVAGIDQRFGRQRVNGSATLRSNHYANNKRFGGQTYNATLGLDWETIENLSGNVTIGADRLQRNDLRDRNGLLVTDSNAETRTRVAASVNLGVAGPLGLQAAVSANDSKYSNAATDYAAFKENSVSGGVSYRLGGATSVSLGARQTRSEYPNLLIGQVDPRDKRRRNDVDLRVVWVPSAVSRLDARISQGKTHHEQVDTRDFSGTSGALTWLWTPGGRLRLTTNLGREIGQNSQFLSNSNGVLSQTTDILRVNADYDLTGKITLNAVLQVYRRNLDGALAGTQSGSDRTNYMLLGARWAPLRSLSTGCQASYERRGNNSNVSLNTPYSANTFSCFGQLVLQ